MTSWQIVSGPSTSAPTAQLTKATSRKFTWNLTAPSTAGFSIDGRSSQAYDLVELATDIHLLRNGVPLYTGRLMSSQEDFDDAKHSLQVAATDVRGLLGRRVLRSDTTWTGDIATVVRNLLANGISAPNTDLGFAIPTFPATGASITRDSKAGASITSEIDAIAGGTQGDASIFDWDVSPGWPGTYPRTAQLWAPSRGRDLTGNGGVVLDYTYRTKNGRLVPRSSPVAKVSRAFDPSTYANLLTVTGGVYSANYEFPAASAVSSFQSVTRGLNLSTPSASVTTTFDDKGTTTQLDDDTAKFVIAIPTQPVTLSDGRTVWQVGTFGAFEAYSDITSQAALNAKAAARAEDLRLVTPTYTVTLKDNWWEGPDHIWIGDTIRLILDTGRLQEDVGLRVTSLDLTLGDDGQESVTLTVGPTRRDELSTLLTHAQRLAALERAAS